MSLSYVFDEHLNGALWRAFQQHNAIGVEPIDVVRVSEISQLPKGNTDPHNLLWAEQNDRILVSRDKKTLPRHLNDHLLAAHSSPGVFIVRKRCNVRQLLDALVYFAQHSQASEWENRVEFIS